MDDRERCEHPSPTGRMRCEKPKDHDSEQELRRLHSGRNSIGSLRSWWEWLPREP